jgi:hypothetical protein
MAALTPLPAHTSATAMTQNPTDESLLAVATAALRGLAALDEERVSVTIRDRVATLTGEVDTHDVRRDARSAIEAIAGVMMVRNDLAVRRSSVEVLDEAQSWALLSTGLGRLATSVDQVVDIFPVNYFVHDRAILFRSAPGLKLVNITREPIVAFEVDGAESRFRWSVVIHGTAKRLGVDSDILESGVKELVSWSPTSKYNYVRITPSKVTGRRILRDAFPRTSLAD